jgi:hypothetical protein
MLLRLPNVPARLAAVFLALILGATLAYLSIRNARADYNISNVQDIALVPDAPGNTRP